MKLLLGVLGDSFDFAQDRRHTTKTDVVDAIVGIAEVGHFLFHILFLVDLLLPFPIDRPLEDHHLWPDNTLSLHPLTKTTGFLGPAK